MRLTPPPVTNEELEDALRHLAVDPSFHTFMRSLVQSRHEITLQFPGAKTEEQRELSGALATMDTIIQQVEPYLNVNHPDHQELLG